MANKQKGFAVFPQWRPSGAAFWLVRGSRDGRQIKREFDNQDDAHAFAEIQNSELLGVKPEQSRLLTHLSPDQLHEMEAAALQLKNDFAGVGILDLLKYYRALSSSLNRDEAERIGSAIGRLKGKFPKADIALACDWFVANYRPPKSNISLTTASEHYLADVARQLVNEELSVPQVERIEDAMAQFEEYIGGSQPLANITTDRLIEYMRETTKGKRIKAPKQKDPSKKPKIKYHPHTNKTWSNRRGYLTAFFEYCRRERWLESNPASQLRTYRKSRRKTKRGISVLTVARARGLMKFLESHEGGRFVPFYAICLFAGIRPDWFHGEISKLKPEHFKFRDGVIRLEAENTKTGIDRAVKIQPNLLKWLKKYPLNKFPILWKNFQRPNMVIRRKFKLEHDVLRHTFCSMHVGKFRSFSETALQAGNSEAVILKNYYHRVDEKVATAFWGIEPK